MKFLADENFHGPLYSALLAKFPAEVLTHVRDVGLLGASDPEILEWAANHGCVVLTHDFSTFPDYAYVRVAAGQLMPGVVQIRQKFSVQRLVNEIELVYACCADEELRDCVMFIP